MTDSTVSIVVPTFGEFATWDTIAERAVKSAHAQTVEVEVLRVHDRTLAKARNKGAEKATGEYLIFLDGDDELDEKFVEFMMAGRGDIRQPSTLGIQNGVPDDYPVLIPQRDLKTSNYLVIGCMIRKEVFEKVGGFEEYPILEDWDFYLRAFLAGTSITAVPEAVYKVHVNPNSRNTDLQLHGQVYTQIRQKHGF